MKLFIGFCLCLNLFVLAGCGSDVMEQGPPPEGDATALEAPELSEEEMEQETSADPDNVE